MFVQHGESGVQKRDESNLLDCFRGWGDYQDECLSVLDYRRQIKVSKFNNSSTHMFIKV